MTAPTMGGSEYERYLSRWSAAGLVTVEECAKIRAYEESEPPPVSPSRRLSLAEFAIYPLVVLGIAAVELTANGILGYQQYEETNSGMFGLFLGNAVLAAIFGIVALVLLFRWETREGPAFARARGALAALMSVAVCFCILFALPAFDPQILGSSTLTFWSFCVMTIVAFSWYLIYRSAWVATVLWIGLVVTAGAIEGVSGYVYAVPSVLLLWLVTGAAIAGAAVFGRKEQSGSDAYLSVIGPLVLSFGACQFVGPLQWEIWAALLIDVTAVVLFARRGEHFLSEGALLGTAILLFVIGVNLTQELALQGIILLAATAIAALGSWRLYSARSVGG